MRTSKAGPQTHEEEFENGYGMSVVIGAYAPGEFNAAVFITATGELVYDTTVMHDTIRCETFEDLIAIREQIKALPLRVTQPTAKDKAELIKEVYLAFYEATESFCGGIGEELAYLLGAIATGDEYQVMTDDLPTVRFHAKLKEIFPQDHAVWKHVSVYVASGLQ